MMKSQLPRYAGSYCHTMQQKIIRYKSSEKKFAVQKITAIIVFAMLFSFSNHSFAQTGSCLDFDGIDDYVNLGNTGNNLGNVTIEAWIKREGSNGVGLDEIWSKEVINAFAVSNVTGQLHVNFGNGAGWGAGVNSNGSAPLNTWTHFAATRDIATGDIKIYLNGVLDTYSPGVNKLTGANTSLRAIGYKPFQLASLAIFDGKIDEVRVYNRVLCQAEIQATMNCELTGTENDLMSYYQFNQGIADDDNTGVTTLTDITGHGNDGTLTNMALSGSNSNWSGPGGVTSGVSCAPYVAPSIQASGNGNNISSGSTATGSSDNTDFGSTTAGTSITKSFDLSNAGTAPLNITSITSSDAAFTISNIPSSIPASGTATIDITFNTANPGVYNSIITINNNTCDIPVYTFTVQATNSGTASALRFDGVNDYINLGNTFNNIGDITMEAWVKMDATTNIFTEIWSKEAVNAFTINHISGKLHVNFGNGFAWGAGVESSTTIPTGVWTHCAATRDIVTGDIKIYINGNLDATYPNQNNLSGSNGYDRGIGYRPPIPWNVSGYAGSFDEIKIYDRVLTESEIQASMNCELSGNESGLQAYYQFNQGNINTDNSGITTLTDNTSNHYDGVLINFALNGANSNWTGPGGVASGVSCSYTYYHDADGDGYGDINNSTVSSSSTAPSGYVTDNTDCDDNNSSVNPGAAEICGNGIDDNCDGQIDEGCSTYTFYRDADIDQHGDPSDSVTNTTGIAPAGYVSDNTDCDDNNYYAYRSAIAFIDSDRDGYDAGTATVCYGKVLPFGYSATTKGTDCNDNNAALWRSATVYIDSDRDGYDGGTTTLCYGATLPRGYLLTTNGPDCDDSNDRKWLSGSVYIDNDGDGYYSGTAIVCYGIDLDQGYSFTTNGIDCDDNNPLLTTAYTFYRDNDKDKKGDRNNFIVSCSSRPPAGYVTDNTDCSDNDRTNTGPRTPGKITGSRRHLCDSIITYSILPVPKAIGYHWIVPKGAIIMEDNGTSILVNLTSALFSGYVSVSAYNGCSESAQRIIYTDSKPLRPIISGPTCITRTATGLEYSATYDPDIVDYVWSVAAPAQIVSGQGTRTVIINWNKAGNGILRTDAYNACNNRTRDSILIRVNNCTTAIAPVTETTTVNNIINAVENTPAQVYPNPARNAAFVSFTSMNGGKYSIVVSDNSGRQLLAKEGTAFIGNNKVQINLNGLTAGSYVVTLITDDGKQSMKLIKDE